MKERKGCFFISTPCSVSAGPTLDQASQLEPQICLNRHSPSLFNLLLLNDGPKADTHFAVNCFFLHFPTQRIITYMTP